MTAGRTLNVQQKMWRSFENTVGTPRNVTALEALQLCCLRCRGTWQQHFALDGIGMTQQSHGDDVPFTIPLPLSPPLP